VSLIGGSEAKRLTVFRLECTESVRGLGPRSREAWQWSCVGPILGQQRHHPL